MISYSLFFFLSGVKKILRNTFSISGLILLTGCSSFGGLGGFGDFGDFGISNLIDRFSSSKDEIQIDEEEIAALKALPTIPLIWKTKVNESEMAVFAPNYENEALYIADEKGVLTRIDPLTGREVWQIKTKLKLSGGVGFGEGLVLVGTFNGEVHAFDESGGELWKARLTSEVLSVPQVSNRIVVVRTGDGRVFGLDASDGSRKWVYQGVTPALTVRNFSGALVSRGAVFVGLSGGKLVAMNMQNGSIGWEAAVSQPKGVTELERMTDITSLPVIDDQQVCAVAYRGRIACFEIMDGNQIWARDASSHVGLVMDNNYIYVSEERGAVVAYDKRSGAMMWKQAKLGTRKLSAPQLVGGASLLVVADAEGNVTLLNRYDGSLVARATTDESPIYSRPEYIPDGFVVQTSKGGIYAFTPQ